MSDIMDNLLPDLVQRTLADPWFAGITVLAEDKSDFLTKIKQGLGYLSGAQGKIGACIVWLEPTTSEAEMSRNMQFGPLRYDLTALVLYDPLPAMNATLGIGLKPQAILRRLRTLKFYSGAGLGSAMQIEIPFCRPADFRFEDMKTETLLAYEARFHCLEADRDSNVKPGPVIFDTSTPGQVAMSCADTSAVIYYTTDGSYPRVGNAAAHVYAAALAVSGVEVRAAAYRPDLVGAVPGNVTGVQT